MRDINFIVLHCTATSQDFPLVYIQNYWRNVLKWNDPGYHFIIEKGGNIICLQDITKPANGVKGYNQNSIHICYIGGIDQNKNPVDNRTVAQKKAQLELIGILKEQFPNAQILGHRDFPNVEKECPSFNVKEWLEDNEFCSQKFYDSK